MSLAENLRKLLETEEGKKSFEEFFGKLTRQYEMLESQLSRFHAYIEKNNNFKEIVEKVIAKYNTKEYCDRWYKRSVEPPEPLSWFLLEYAERYGRELTEEELEGRNLMFTSAIYELDGYIFERVDGQGSLVLIYKK